MAPWCAHRSLRRYGWNCAKVCGMKKWLIVLGVVLLILGVAAIVHPDINYSKKEEVLKVGPVQANVEREDTFHVPAGVFVLLLVAGLSLVVIGARVQKSRLRCPWSAAPGRK